jgi:hypothetical protein
MGISLVKSNATNKDLRNAIEKAYPFACKQIESKVLARKLRGRTDQETARNIFNWVVTNIKYNKDGANQIVRLPSGILRTKEGDCKSMSLLIASLLLFSFFVDSLTFELCSCVVAVLGDKEHKRHID